MTVKKPGDKVLIPVSVQPGPFDRERLVSFEGVDGPVSGFVPADQIVEKGTDKFIEAEVVSSTNVAISVRLRGSFFTTTGLAHIKTAA